MLRFVFKSDLIVTGVNIQTFKSIGKLNMPELTKRANCYVRMDVQSLIKTKPLLKHLELKEWPLNLGKLL